VVEPGELGVPGVSVVLVDGSGNQVAETITESDGTFAMEGIPSGSYQAAIAGSEFREPWGGIIWLGKDLITYSAMFAGLWVWGGFALLIIAAGLASLPRDTLEAARVDGANEWQVFRHVTVPQLSPVLIVVFIALTINALKMFDLIVGIAPGSVQDDANVIALEMWRTAFTGIGNRGLGSAIAVFLFILILPILLFNIRRFTIAGRVVPRHRRPARGAATDGTDPCVLGVPYVGAEWHPVDLAVPHRVRAPLCHIPHAQLLRHDPWELDRGGADRRCQRGDDLLPDHAPTRLPRHSRVAHFSIHLDLQ
jgi:hypothetical protein